MPNFSRISFCSSCTIVELRQSFLRRKGYYKCKLTTFKLSNHIINGFSYLVFTPLKRQVLHLRELLQELLPGRLSVLSERPRVSLRPSPSRSGPGTCPWSSLGPQWTVPCFSPRCRFFRPPWPSLTLSEKQTPSARLQQILDPWNSSKLNTQHFLYQVWNLPLLGLFVYLFRPCPSSRTAHVRDKPSWTLQRRCPWASPRSCCPERCWQLLLDHYHWLQLF